ncbi:Rv1535 domain-containing protein [Mycolicibacterium elephantis]|uniref:Rv1535 domain-containing protein n=1 Tax=Mycolicibacterium elephantis TaxID=81858 RepID=UPI001F4DA529|nr:Rv1535 domain-containing protein [Mycolicibacterium elephantis]
MRGAIPRFFRHWWSPCHGVFDVWTPADCTVVTVSSTGVKVGSDPLTDAVAGVLLIPLRELYAVLWRAGVVEIDG